MKENFSENIPSNPYYDNSKDFYGDDININSYMDIEEVVSNISKWLDSDNISNVQYVLNSEEDKYLKYSKIFDIIIDNYKQEVFDDLTNVAIEDVINYIAYELTTDLYVENKTNINIITSYDEFKESLIQNIDDIRDDENDVNDEEYEYEPEEHEDDSERRPDIQMNNLGWKNK